MEIAFRRLLVVSLAIGLAQVGVAQDKKPDRGKAVAVAGRVVDDKGKPIKDAEVGIDWSGDDKQVKADAPLTTDKNGKFVGDFLIDPKQPAVFMAMDKLHKLGGWTVTADDKLDRLEIVLQPLTSVNGSFDVSRRLAEGTQIFRIRVSFGSVNSSITLPGCMSHASIPAEVREARSLAPDLVRLSVGIEDADDLIADLDQAFARAGQQESRGFQVAASRR